MAFTISDKDEPQNNLQSIFFQEYIDILVAGIGGLDCVLSGCAVTAQGSPDMTVAVAKGAVRQTCQSPTEIKNLYAVIVVNQAPALV